MIRYFSRHGFYVVEQPKRAKEIRQDTGSIPKTSDTSLGSFLGISLAIELHNPNMYFLLILFVLTIDYTYCNYISLLIFFLTGI